eukprot:TCONS_00037555-protein
MDAKSSKSKASFYRKRDTICNTSLEDCDFFKECTAFEPEELPVTPPGEDSEFVEDTDYDMQSNNSDEDDLDDFSEFFGKLLHDPQFSADNDLVEALQSLEDDATDNFLADDDEFFDCEDLSSEGIFFYQKDQNAKGICPVIFLFQDVDIDPGEVVLKGFLNRVQEKFLIQNLISRGLWDKKFWVVQPLLYRYFM